MKTNLLLIASLLASAASLRAGGGQWTVTAWNNLGMHCMDDDYSVFSILPPFNTINAQVMNAQGQLVKNPTTANIIVTYEAVADPDGSINTTATGKTNFYDYVAEYFGANVPVDSGLAGHAMPGTANTPQPMAWDGSMNWFEATGVPITPYDDEHRKNPYPLFRISARNATTNAVLASADVVVPVSDEMDCRACHASGSGAAAQPAAGWVNDPNDKRDFRLNILRLHDERNAANPDYAAALSAMGFSAGGLYDSVVNQAHPVLCALCHESEALGTGGATNVKSLTAAMHSKHATVINPKDNLPLNSQLSRNACYVCHPGSETRCLRGAMGSSVNPSDGSMTMQCQSCHGDMNDVGSLARTGWLDEPNCQACHSGDALSNEGMIRFVSVFSSPGTMRVPANQRFATNPDTPAPGVSLFRFSQGHGGLSCSACHGSTHAEYPASHRNDNLYSWNKQGHRGKLADCTVCHATMPSNSVGGPHGIHPIGSTNWVKDHADIARNVGISECRECHGGDYRGTELSRAQADRHLSTKFGPFVLKRGMEVSCYYCHNGPNSSNPSSHVGPTVASGQLSVPLDTPTATTLTASGTNPAVRVIEQPMHGTVGISGTTATYFPFPSYQGPDVFTYIASDPGSYIDSQPATISISVGTPDATRDTDGDGVFDFVEYALGLDPMFPSLETQPQVQIENVGGTSYLTLHQLRSPMVPPDTSFTFQATGNLTDPGSWVPATLFVNTDNEVHARDVAPASGNDARFMRIDVIRQTPAP